MSMDCLPLPSWILDSTPSVVLVTYSFAKINSFLGPAAANKRERLGNLGNCPPVANRHRRPSASTTSTNCKEKSPVDIGATAKSRIFIHQKRLHTLLFETPNSNSKLDFDVPKSSICRVRWEEYPLTFSKDEARNHTTPCRPNLQDVAFASSCCVNLPLSVNSPLGLRTDCTV
jgi:hypothetical protein